MTHAIPSAIKPKKGFRFWAAAGSPVNLWAALSEGGSQLFWVLGGKFALMGANAAVMLFLAKRLDLATYGLLVLTISGQLLISRLLLMGVDVGMMRLTAIPELRSREHEVVTAGLGFIACTSAVLILISLLVGPLVTRYGIPDWAIRAIVIGSIGTAFVDYGYSFRLARQEFPQAALAQGGTAIWRLGLTIIAAIPLVVQLVVVTYHGASLCSGIVQAFLIAKVNWRRPDFSLIKRLLRYSFWQGKTNVIVIFSLYQGTFLLIFLKQQAATGIFGLALTLSLGFFAIYNAYFEYLMARMRSVELNRSFPRFVVHGLFAALVLTVACVPVVFALVKLLPWFLGAEWLQVVPIFIYLAAAMASLILQAPLEAACHYLLKPQLISFGWMTRAALVAIAGLILAPRMGATGAAIAQLLGFAFGLLVLSFLVVGSWRSATRVQS
jgi:O-antigen/teichoic acid export membrane protein